MLNVFISLRLVLIRSIKLLLVVEGGLHAIFFNVMPPRAVLIDVFELGLGV